VSRGMLWIFSEHILSMSPCFVSLAREIIVSSSSFTQFYFPHLKKVFVCDTIQIFSANPHEASVLLPNFPLFAFLSDIIRDNSS